MCDVQYSSTNVLDKGYKVVGGCFLAKPSQTVYRGAGRGMLRLPQHPLLMKGNRNAC